MSKRFAFTVITILLILVLTLTSFFYISSQQNTGKFESIVVAYSPFESTALFLVAEEQGFFEQNALNVTVRNYDSGAEALGGVLNGEADIAIGTTEFPLVIRALNQEDIQTLGSISKSNFIYLVGRTDRGIVKPSDLRGKSIGTTVGTIADYFLGRFLILNGINRQDVTIVDLKTPIEWSNAVVNGSVDAVATAQPYADLARDGLGSNAVFWSIHSNQPLYAQAIATSEWITANPELCRRFLKSLYQAEEFVIDHPAEAKAIVKQAINFSDSYIEVVWSQNQFFLSLDHSLILAMESEARWLIGSNLTSQSLVPDFYDNIYLEGLVSVKPRSVNIIG